jgi:hypothetical protein
MGGGYPYALNCDGVVVNIRTGIPRKPQYNCQNGYAMLTLTKDGRYKNFYVHRLVAELFVPNPHNYKYVIHVDGDKHNNKSNNLAYISYDEWRKMFKNRKD